MNLVGRGQYILEYKKRGDKISLQSMRVGCSTRTTLDFREEAGVRLSVNVLDELGGMGRLHETGAGSGERHGMT